MIDFLKYELAGIAPDLLEANPLLEFETKVNTRTAELGAYSHAYYKGLEFKIYHRTTANPNGRITVEGSLHKYWNDGGHNFNDFTVSNLADVLKDLKTKFNIVPENCFIKQLEIGVNLSPPFPTKTVLQCCLLHKTDLFKWVFTSDEGNYIQVQHGNYFIKIYDKQKHYTKKGFNVPDEVMRFEIKYKKAKLNRDLNIEGVITLKDVLTFGLQKFKPLLLQEWQNVLFYDFTTLDKTPFKERYSNPIFWVNLKPENLKYHRKNLNRITNYNPVNLKKTIADILAMKIDFLNTKTTRIKPLNIPLIQVVHSIPSKVQINRRCNVTGVNIEMQKENSFLLSHEGLKYYYRTDRKIYNEVKRKFLTDKWKRSKHTIQIREIAHNIRNTFNNRRIKERRIYPENQPQLFPVNQYA